MATLLVAGCVAVLRETLVKNGMTNPPAALLKSLLINGAVDMKGQYGSIPEIGPSPNSINGWGRVDLAGSCILPNVTSNAYSGLGIGPPLAPKGQKDFVIHVPAPPSGGGNQAPLRGGGQGSGLKLKITLVWTDPPGPLLQNNLNLIVKAANGEERHGNMGAGNQGFDTLNNVEQVSWVNIPVGDAAVTVRCDYTTQLNGTQDYAYSWRLLTATP